MVSLQINRGMLMQFKSVCLALSFGELTPTPVEQSCAPKITPLPSVDASGLIFQSSWLRQIFGSQSPDLFRSLTHSLMRSMLSGAYMPRKLKRE